MNLKQLIIAFLSPRYPAAYTEASIAQRLNASQMLDKRTRSMKSPTPCAPSTR